MKNEMTYGSLFSGVGGFDMGFDQAGFQCVFQVEWDKHCQSILKKHWASVPKWSDVQDVDGSTIPPCDILIFGSPCQDLSTAGKRAGIDGERSSMFFEAVRIIKEMRNATSGQYPKIAVWENVAGALSSNRGADFGVVLEEMVECGAHVTEWAVLDAQHFGVAHRRRRVFLAAILDDDIARKCPDKIFPVQEGSCRNSGKTGETGFFYSTHGIYDRFLYDIAPPLKTVATLCVASEGIRPRKLTPIEHERLMGWADDHTRWTDNGSEQADTHRYKQCGNGVVTPVAKWVAECIRKVAVGE